MTRWTYAWIAGGVVVAAVLGSFAWSLAHPPVAASNLVGKPAPDLVLRSLDGRTIPLRSLRGSPVVINFWASWCGPCRIEDPALTTAARESAGRVQFLGVNIQDSDVAARAYEREAQHPYPVGPAVSGSYLDFAVRAPPETFFLDAAGKVVGMRAGPIDLATIRSYLAKI
jgi:cytochrome c biogenesis protein CcmG/thiol:disulfide interchange protein DsbE